MNIAIVARGLHHDRLPAHYPHLDIIIGVNHAAAMYPCDWWCFGDMEAGRDITPLSRPRWFTNENAALRLGRQGITPPADTLRWESLKVPGRWTVFSSCAALVLAHHLGAPRVIGIGLYTVNFPGPVAGEEQRWATERAIWQETLAALRMEVQCPAS